MRELYSAAEFARMIAALRAHPPRKGESIHNLADRLRDYSEKRFLARTHAPSPTVVRNVVRAAGFKLRARLYTRQGNGQKPLLLHWVRWRRKPPRPIDLWLEYHGEGKHAHT